MRNSFALAIAALSEKSAWTDPSRVHPEAQQLFGKPHFTDQEATLILKLLGFVECSSWTCCVPMTIYTEQGPYKNIDSQNLELRSLTTRQDNLVLLRTSRLKTADLLAEAIKHQLGNSNLAQHVYVVPGRVHI